MTRLSVAVGILTTLMIILGGCGTPNVPQAPLQTAGVIDIPMQFLGAGPFAEGLAPVQVGDHEKGKWGYIDKTGKIVIQPQFDSAKQFSDGVAAVLIGGHPSGGYAGGKWGFIDKTGQYVINPQFDDLWSPGFIDGTARVIAGIVPGAKTELINHRGEILFANTWPGIMGFSEGLAAIVYEPSALYPHALEGFINNQGVYVISPRFKRVGYFNEGLASVQVVDRGTEKWGYINSTGAFVIPPILMYDLVSAFHDGYAKVLSRDYQYGFIDNKGTLAIPIQFSFADDFYEGIAAVHIGNDENGRWGYIDRAGRYIVNPVFTHASRFSTSGLAAVCTTDNKWGLIDKSGHFIVAATYDEMGSPDRSVVSVGIKTAGKTKWGLMKTDGTIVMPPTSDVQLTFSEGFAPVSSNGKWGYVKF